MNSNITELCKLAFRYGTDKCPQLKHAYTPFYYGLLKDKQQSVKKVLEIGVGYYRGMQENEVIYEPGLNRQYHRGASLYMWRDFFPNAQVYGADIREETVFEDERLKTYQCDARSKEDLLRLIENIGTDIDLIVDDASHHVDDQIFACQTLMPLLKKDAIYIIEDVGHSKMICRAMSAIGDYEFNIPDIPRKWSGGMIVVITNAQHE